MPPKTSGNAEEVAEIMMSAKPSPDVNGMLFNYLQTDGRKSLDIEYLEEDAYLKRLLPRMLKRNKFLLYARTTIFDGVGILKKSLGLKVHHRALKSFKMKHACMLFKLLRQIR